jgi:tetratricopeptide (TPR) repeat protein
MTPRPSAPAPSRGMAARDQAERAAAVRVDDDRRMRSEALEVETSRAMRPPIEQQRESWPPPGSPPALTGDMATIKKLIDKRDVDGALAKARDWHVREPGNVLALIALGDALEAKGSLVTASRVYGSIIDLFPGRADMRRFAGERLARLSQLDLMIDTYKRAVADRPDHLTGHRLLAYAYERAGKHEDAFKTILSAMDQQYRSDSYRGAERVLAEDAGMLGAAYAAASPTKRADLVQVLRKRNLELAHKAKSYHALVYYWVGWS